MTTTTIFKTKQFRIIETLDTDYNLNDLKGDCFKPDCNDDIELNELKERELQFERKVETESVYGYELEKFNMETMEFEHVDSCYGFVGKHVNENHYIINEFKKQILETELKNLIDNAETAKIAIDVIKKQFINHESGIIKIECLGKRWFDQKNGNTYNCAKMIITKSNNEVSEIVFDFDYGYGDSWLKRCKEHLKNELKLKFDYVNDFEVMNIEFSSNVQDVLKRNCNFK